MDTPIATLTKSFCDRLRQARAEAGYRTTREFADKHDIAYNTYYCHETGRRTPNLDDIAKYAELLHVRKYWLAFGEGPPTLKDADQDGRAPMHRQLDRIKPDDLPLVDALLNRLDPGDQPAN